VSAKAQRYEKKHFFSLVREDNYTFSMRNPATEEFFAIV